MHSSIKHLNAKGLILMKKYVRSLQRNYKTHLKETKKALNKWKNVLRNSGSNISVEMYFFLSCKSAKKKKSDSQADSYTYIEMQKAKHRQE